MNHTLGSWNFCSSFTYTGWVGVSLCLRNINFLLLLHTQDVLLEKHDQTAESHTGVLGQKKKNFFSSSTYTGWGSYNYVNHQATFAGGLS